MSQLLPNATTVLDLCTAALKDAGALGIGQSPNGIDISDAQARLQWMLQQWERERWLIYHLVTYILPSTGQITPYAIGAGGNFSTDFGVSFSTGVITNRPNRIESAFFQQINSIPNGPIQYRLKLLNSMEDYVKIALPSLSTFALCAFYDPAWPTGNLYLWPWPQANNYNIGIVVREQLPTSFANLSTVINLPYEYYQAIVSNLAMALRPKYGINTSPGDSLPAAAKNSLAILRKGNFAIPSLDMPVGLSRNGIYNIFSDQNY